MDAGGAANLKPGGPGGGWRRHKHKACQHRMPERFFQKEIELARSMLGGAPCEPGKRESGESMRSGSRWRVFRGVGVFVTMVTVENESREGAWPGSSLIEAEAGHVETDSHEECRGMSLLRTGLNSIRLRSGSFRPGPAAHKPSREGINRLQSVGSPHVTDEEGFPDTPRRSPRRQKPGGIRSGIDVGPLRPPAPHAPHKPRRGGPRLRPGASRVFLRSWPYFRGRPR